MARWRDGQFRVDEEWCGDAAVFVNWLYRTFCIFNVSMVPDGHHHTQGEGSQGEGSRTWAYWHQVGNTRNTQYEIWRSLPAATSYPPKPNFESLAFQPEEPVSNFVLLLQTIDSATCRSPAPSSVHSFHLQESPPSEICLLRLTRPFPPPVSRECRAEERSADGLFVDAPAAIGPYCQVRSSTSRKIGADHPHRLSSTTV
jgi:hypothetical protein